MDEEEAEGEVRQRPGRNVRGRGRKEFNCENPSNGWRTYEPDTGIVIEKSFIDDIISS